MLWLYYSREVIRTDVETKNNISIYCFKVGASVDCGIMGRLHLDSIDRNCRQNESAVNNICCFDRHSSIDSISGQQLGDNMSSYEIVDEANCDDNCCGEYGVSSNEDVATELRHRDDALYDGHISDGCDRLLNEGVKTIDIELHYVWTDEGYRIDLATTLQEAENQLISMDKADSFNW